MFGSMSIRTRLVFSFAVLLGLLLAVAAVSLQRFEVLTSTTQRIVDYEVKRVFLAQRANQHAQAAAICLLNLLQTPEREKRKPLYASMDAELAASDMAVGDLGMTLVTPEVRAGIERVTGLRKIYGESFQETVELIELEGTAAARLHFESRTQTALNTLLLETLALARHQQQQMQVDLEQIKTSAANARQTLIALAMVALAAGALLAFAIGRSIVKPVREAVFGAETIAGGDYKKHVPTGQKDEIGALMLALSVMRDSIGSREDRIARLAYVDTLTGLPNRTHFLVKFAALPAGSSGALVILDVDRFAAINNALGHAIGDRLLCEISTRLARVAGQGNIARLWGDEFALLLPGADETAAAAQVRGVLAALRVPMSVDGQRLDINVSMGVALFGSDEANIAALLRRADGAMVRAKRRHDGFAFGSELDDEPEHEELSLIGEMREALVRNEFVVFYQPKLNLSKNRISGAEALIRWRHPTKGMIAPMRFIPFAEQTGFIREITPWLLEHVIEQAAQWRRSGMTVVASVNLSTLDLLNRDLVPQIQGLLDRFDLPAEQLCLEITESALMDEPELALKHLNELSAHGLKLSIDDYGSGQASLGYVKSLPVNELKIDRVFVTDVDSTPKNAAIVRSTILLCRELGLSVVAEGAENSNELDWLKDNGCDVVQGYVIAKPMALDDFVAWVDNFDQNNSSQKGKVG